VSALDALVHLMFEIIQEACGEGRLS